MNKQSVSVFDHFATQLSKNASGHAAEIVSKTGTHFTLRTSSGEEFTAIVAFSCLLTPEEGDQVAVFRDGECAFVTAILEAGSTEQRSLNFAHMKHTSIHANSIDIRTNGPLDIISQSIGMSAPRITLVGKRLRHLFDGIISQVGQLFVSADTMQHHVKTEIASSESRTIQAGASSEHYGSQMVVAEAIISQHSATAVLVAKGDIRMDAERVSVG